jgi:hypothetical protein
LKVLVACEYSGIVREAFRAKGHDAWSCDIIESEDNSEYHYHCKVEGLVESIEWDLMIAHPPCTYISRAGARWMYENNKINKIRLQQALEAKQFFLNLFNSNIKYIALENPTPLTILKMPQFTQAVQPFEFGHPYSKRTLLWLKNLPLLKSTNIIREYEPFLPSNTGGKKKGQSYSFGVSKNWKDSSTTFKGIAKAMAEQWSKPGIVQSKLF